MIKEDDTQVVSGKPSKHVSDLNGSRLCQRSLFETEELKKNAIRSTTTWNKQQRIYSIKTFVLVFPMNLASQVVRLRSNSLLCNRWAASDGEPQIICSLGLKKICIMATLTEYIEQHKCFNFVEHTNELGWTLWGGLKFRRRSWIQINWRRGEARDGSCWMHASDEQVLPDYAVVRKWISIAALWALIFTDEAQAANCGNSRNESKVRPSGAWAYLASWHLWQYRSRLG